MTVTFRGKTLKLQGTLPKEGEKIKDFSIVNNKMETLKFSSLLSDECPTLLITIPSCDTQVCSLELKTFQEEFQKKKIQFNCIVISMDLPFAQERWQKENHCATLSLFSDFRFKECGETLGVLIPDLGLLARACFIIDENQMINYQQLVPEVTQEPDYKKVFQSISKQVKVK